MRDTIQTLFITFASIGALASTLYHGYLRFANPDMTETRIFLNHWPEMGVLLLFVFLCLFGAGALRRD